MANLLPNPTGYDSNPSGSECDTTEFDGLNAQAAKVMAERDQLFDALLEPLNRFVATYLMGDRKPLEHYFRDIYAAKVELQRNMSEGKTLLDCCQLLNVDDKAIANICAEVSSVVDNPTTCKPTIHRNDARYGRRQAGRGNINARMDSNKGTTHNARWHNKPCAAIGADPRVSARGCR